MRWLIGLWVAALLIAGVAACGDGDQPEDTTQSVIDPPTTSPDAEGEVAGDQPVVPSGRAADLPGPGEPWHVLFLTDRSDPISDTVAEHYRQLAQDALGVEVEVLAGWGGSYPDAPFVLNSIRGGAYPPVTDQVREAEIIVVKTWARGVLPETEGVNLGEWLHGLGTDSFNPAVFEADQYWAQYRDVLNEIYAEIWSLRGGAPTVLIGIDYYNPWLARYREAGREAEGTAFLEAWSDMERAAAEGNGAIWVSLFDVVNGPEHNIDAVEAGYLGASEQMPTAQIEIPNEVGSAMIAEALAAAGFDAVTPP